MKTALVCGAGGFIGSHLVKVLKQEGFWVRGADLKQPEFSVTAADQFLQGDLSEQAFCRSVVDRRFDEIYQLAADMGGAGYIFTGDNDAQIMRNSAMINLNVLEQCRLLGVGRIFYSSSACIYPQGNQADAHDPITREDSAYPADPDSEYGWEKLFSERLYQSYARNFGMACRIARYHNVFGPEGAYVGGREKAPAAVCRKIAEAPAGGEIEIWGDGLQTRSFLYIDECLTATLKLTRSACGAPINIGSEEMVSINELAHIVMKIAGKDLRLRHIPGPLGVRGRKSDNALIAEVLKWRPQNSLSDGLALTYPWIERQLRAQTAAPAGGGGG